MKTHWVKVTQVSRVEREILVEVEAETIHDAIAKQQDSDAPDLRHPDWKTVCSELMNEEVTPA